MRSCWGDDEKRRANTTGRPIRKNPRNDSVLLLACLRSRFSTFARWVFSHQFQICFSHFAQFQYCYAKHEFETFRIKRYVMCSIKCEFMIYDIWIGPLFMIRCEWRKIGKRFSEMFSPFLWNERYAIGLNAWKGAKCHLLGSHTKRGWWQWNSVRWMSSMSLIEILAKNIGLEKKARTGDWMVVWRWANYIHRAQPSRHRMKCNAYIGATPTHYMSSRHTATWVSSRTL